MSPVYIARTKEVAARMLGGQVAANAVSSSGLVNVSPGGEAAAACSAVANATM
jgi:hypothetical protein